MRQSYRSALVNLETWQETSAVVAQAFSTSSWWRSPTRICILGGGNKSQSDLPITDEERGVQMLYSSGTTGQPKGVLPKRVPGDPITVMTPTASALRAKFGFDENTVYLSLPPSYHAAPLTYNTLTMHSGGTSIIMGRFDAEQSQH